MMKTIIIKLTWPGNTASGIREDFDVCDSAHDVGVEDQQFGVCSFGLDWPLDETS